MTESLAAQQEGCMVELYGNKLTNKTEKDIWWITFSASSMYSLLREEESDVKINVRRSVTTELILEA